MSASRYPSMTKAYASRSASADRSLSPAIRYRAGRGCSGMATPREGFVTGRRTYVLARMEPAQPSQIPKLASLHSFRAEET